jgi:hypothetical protein
LSLGEIGAGLWAGGGSLLKSVGSVGVAGAALLGDAADAVIPGDAIDTSGTWQTAYEWGPHGQLEQQGASDTTRTAALYVNVGGLATATGALGVGTLGGSTLAVRAELEAVKVATNPLTVPVTVGVVEAAAGIDGPSGIDDGVRVLDDIAEAAQKYTDDAARSLTKQCAARGTPPLTNDPVTARMRIVNTAQQIQNTKPIVGHGSRIFSAAERAEFNAFADRARAVGLVENPFRTGSWGRTVNGKFQEVARIDIGDLTKGGHQRYSHLKIPGVGNHLPVNTPIPGE